MSTEPKLRTSMRLSGIIGALGAVALLGGGTWWAAETSISGAVIAIGSVEVVGRPKTVQHLDGGIIAAIDVQEGDTVAQGDILMQLDGTTLQANQKIYRSRLSEALALRDRLIAEQTGAETIRFADVDPLVLQEDAALHRSGQSEIFFARRELEAGRVLRLTEKIAQFGNQIKGVEALIEAKEKQIAFIAEEIDAVQQLTEKGLARASQGRALQRSEAELLGQVAEHRSELARIYNSIRDAEIERLQGRRQITEEVVTELRDTTTRIEELRQQILSTAAQLERVDIRAPSAGRVHELQFTTNGGVIPPGAVILQIIPRDQGYAFQTRVDPVSIDQIYVGQSTKVRFPAFNQRTTPELIGSVKDISATTSVDDASGTSFFRVQIDVSADELARLGDVELIPGMPVEAYLTTNDRTVLSYLVKPLTDQVEQAFREE